MENIYRIQLGDGKIFPLNKIIRCGYIKKQNKVYDVICKIPENFAENMLKYKAIIQDNKVIELKEN